MNKTLRQILSIGILTLFLTQIGFSQSIEKFVDSTIEVDSLNVPTDLKQPYFPKEMFPEVEMDWIKTDKGTKIETKVKEGNYDEFVVNWYSKHLHAMKEPLLFNSVAFPKNVAFPKMGKATFLGKATIRSKLYQTLI